MTRPATWSIRGVEYPYFEPTHGHERDVELPFGYDVLRHATGRVLEVGNSTQAWYPDLPERDIVCRYDELGGKLPVRRVDIVGWDPGYRYDTIVSLSTFEHVGHDWPEYPIDGKAQYAVEHCLELLAPGGQLAFTIPCGFHGSFQDWVVAQPWTEIYLMARVSGDNEWVERPVREYKPQDYPGGWGCAGKILMVRHHAPG